MQQLFEFVGNHLYLWIGLVAVLGMLIKSEFDSRVGAPIHLSAMNAIRLINNNDDALVIDVRESTAFKKGHIKGAINLPLSSIKDKIGELATQNKDSAVLAYCNSGATSTRACRLLKQAGFSNVHNIAGGINGWSDAKLPVTIK